MKVFCTSSGPAFLMFALFVTLTAVATESGYPPHWWKPVPKGEAKSWEILPQEAGSGEVILSKRNELGILSNFAATSFEFRNKRYASLEGFWQMMKFPEGDQDPRALHPGIKWTYRRSDVAQMVSFDAKHAGDEGSRNMREIGINWVTFEGKQMPYRTLEKGEHYQLIYEAMWAKLRQNAEVKSVLLKTGTLILRPDHHQKPETPPAWKYNQIWMDIRAKLSANPELGKGP